MKVREIKQLKIYLSKEENDKIEIITGDTNINKEKLVKYIQMYNIKNIIDIEVYYPINDDYIIELKAEVK